MHEPVFAPAIRAGPHCSPVGAFRPEMRAILGGMSTLAFDTLAFSKRLQAAGIPPEQAEAQASAQAEFLNQHVLSQMATKDDLRREIEGLRKDTNAAIEGLCKDTNAAIESLRKDMDIQLSQMKAQLSQMENRQTLRMFAMVGSLVAFITLIEFVLA